MHSGASSCSYTDVLLSCSLQMHASLSFISAPCFCPHYFLPPCPPHPPPAVAVTGCSAAAFSSVPTSPSRIPDTGTICCSSEELQRHHCQQRHTRAGHPALKLYRKRYQLTGSPCPQQGACPLMPSGTQSSRRCPLLATVVVTGGAPCSLLLLGQAVTQSSRRCPLLATVVVTGG